MTASKIDRPAIFRDAWTRARIAAAAAGESVRRHIGAAMRAAWAEAKATAAAMVPQPVQQQQAQAAKPLHTAVDAEIHTVKNLGGALDELARVIRGSYLAPGLSHNKVLSDHLADCVETSRRYITQYPSAHAYADALQTTSQAYGFIIGIGLTDLFPVITRACNLTRDAAVAWAEPLHPLRMVPQPCQQQQANAGTLPAGACEVCGRPLTDPVSIEAGIGPICRAAGHRRRQLGLFDNPSDYRIELAGDVICVTDLDLGGRTVTNDAAGVIGDLLRLGYDLSRMPVIYRDTQGHWDELVVLNGSFAGFRGISADRKLALREIARVGGVRTGSLVPQPLQQT